MALSATCLVYRNTKSFSLRPDIEHTKGIATMAQPVAFSKKGKVNTETICQGYLLWREGRWKKHKNQTQYFHLIMHCFYLQVQQLKICSFWPSGVFQKSAPFLFFSQPWLTPAGHAQLFSWSSFNIYISLLFGAEYLVCFLKLFFFEKELPGTTKNSKAAGWKPNTSCCSS